MKHKMKPTIAIVVAIALLGLIVAAPCQAMAKTVAEGSDEPSAKSRGLAAIDAAARNGKYLFVFFWKANGKQNQAMRGVLESAMKKWKDSADSISISITDPNEKPIVDKYNVSRAPMPLVLALAPNGAITRGFPVKFDEKQLAKGFVSPATEKCLKYMQDKKLVLVCIQNGKTQFSQIARKSALDFQADKRFAKTTGIVMVDPEDKAEHPMLKGLKVAPQTTEAIIVVLTPLGPIAKFVGNVTKDQIVAKIASAQSGPRAGGKCGPGGCCPK